jgi:hypothetical protein
VRPVRPTPRQPLPHRNGLKLGPQLFHKWAIRKGQGRAKGRAAAHGRARRGARGISP